MTIVVERHFTVAADPDVVLEYLSDLAHTEQWEPATRRTIRTGAGPIGVGATWHHVSKVLGVTTELTYTLTVREPGRVVFAGRNEGATSTATLTVRPVDGGAEVTWHLDLEMHGVAKLATPVVKIELERLGDEAATRLTGILNRLVSPAPPGTPTGP